MNKANGEMYNWIDYTWNLLTGCDHECEYCYMKSMPFSNMTPRKSKTEFSVKPPAASRFFIGSSGDMFCKSMKDDWIHEALSLCNDMFSTYVLQTKNPGRYLDFLDYFDSRFILGTTIESNREHHLSKAPSVEKRAYAMFQIPGDIKRFITVEPVLDLDLDEMLEYVLLCVPDFVNIGADSKHHNLAEPDASKLNSLIKELEKETEVRLKKNLSRLL